MTSLLELLGEEFCTPDAQHRLELAREDQKLLEELIKLRKKRMRQDEVAERMGVSQPTVSSFERLGNDPRLSTIRRYAQAVGAMVRHQVDPDSESHLLSESLTHFTADGILSEDTAACRARKMTETTKAEKAQSAWPAAATTPVKAEPRVLTKAAP